MNEISKEGKKREVDEDRKLICYLYRRMRRLDDGGAWLCLKEIMVMDGGMRPKRGCLDGMEYYLEKK